MEHGVRWRVQTSVLLGATPRETRRPSSTGDRSQPQSVITVVQNFIAGQSDYISSHRKEAEMRSPVSWWIRGYRLLFAALASVAVLAQLMQSIDADRSTVDFFSYFTIQSNLIAIGVLLWGALKAFRAPGPLSRDVIRGAAVLHLAVTGIVFAALLSGQPLVTVPFSNSVLHKLMPIVMVADWIIDPPSEDIDLRTALLWYTYPVIWLLYTMIRGALIGWYPYPFLDPAAVDGMGNVLGITALLLIAAAVLIAAIVAIGRAARRRVG